MNTLNPKDNPAMIEFMKRAINAEIAKSTEEEFERMKERLDQRKAEIVAGVVLHVQRSMNIQESGDVLSINIKLT